MRLNKAVPLIMPLTQPSVGWRHWEPANFTKAAPQSYSTVIWRRWIFCVKATLKSKCFPRLLECPGQERWQSAVTERACQHCSLSQGPAVTPTRTSRQPAASWQPLWLWREPSAMNETPGKGHCSPEETWQRLRHIHNSELKSGLLQIQGQYAYWGPNSFL